MNLDGPAFLVIKSGCIAVGSQETKPGNRVSVISGGGVPLVLREVLENPRGTSAFIGNAFVRRFVEGEALSNNLTVGETITLV